MDAIQLVDDPLGDLLGLMGRCPVLLEDILCRSAVVPEIVAILLARRLIFLALGASHDPAAARFFP